MKKIQILGTGCAKCRKLEQNAREAAKAMGLDCQLEKVTQIQQIISFGVVVTPALVVDGVVKVAGQVPDVPTIQTLLR